MIVNRPEIADLYLCEILRTWTGPEVSKLTLDMCKAWCLMQHGYTEKENFYNLYDFREWIYCRIVDSLVFQVYKKVPRKKRERIVAKICAKTDHFSVFDFAAYL